MRVAILFHRFGPYHCARLEAASCNCEITAIEIAAETAEYEWSPVKDIERVERITLFAKGDSGEKSAGEVSRRMHRALSSCSPNAVAIPGWSNRGAIAALRWCFGTWTPAILMSESTAHDEPRNWWRETIKRRIVGLYSTALVGGQRHIDYLVDLGMPRDRIFTGYDVVDNEYFRRKAKEIRDQKSSVRQEYGLPENYFLASARFIEKKNIATLLRAYAEYQKAIGEHAWKLVLLGDGPLKSDLHRLISDLGLHDSVVLPGFKQYDELPVYYAFAKAFVHASRTEQWGLVVNEAVASGLPVIVSDRCGCVPELARDKVNGFTFDPDDRENLTRELTTMSTIPEATRDRFARGSTEIADDFQTRRFGEGLKSAGELAINLTSKNATFFDRVLLSAVLRSRV